MISASACQTGGGQLQIGYLRIYVDKSVQKDIVGVKRAPKFQNPIMFARDFSCSHCGQNDTL
jgi:hypothetical protein